MPYRVTAVTRGGACSGAFPSAADAVAYFRQMAGGRLTRRVQLTKNGRLRALWLARGEKR